MLRDIVAFIGHEVHICRSREMRTLRRWLGGRADGRRIVDVGGGDGYWASRVRGAGSTAVAVDLDAGKLAWGRRLRGAPLLVASDALELPFGDGSFDVVLSVCAIEHFPDGGRALDEMVRVLAPGGEIVLSADSLTQSSRWPDLRRGHERRYDVRRTYTHGELTDLLAERGMEVLDHRYIFRGRWAEWLYLQLSRRSLAWNLSAPLAPLLALSDRRAGRRPRRAGAEGGSVVLIYARRG